MSLHFRIVLSIHLALIFAGNSSLAVIPSADFTANNQAICIGVNTTFTNTSTGTITSYSWNFGSGASPSTANTIGPHNVIYSTSGSKTVSLTVSGPDGTVTTTKINYINVGVQRIKLMSYNLLNYTDFQNSDTTIRHPYFRTIISAADPDILTVQEVTSSNAMNAFLNKVMNANGNVYSVGTFINGFDTDNGIFYKSSKFQFISNIPIETDLRDINEFKLKNILTGDTLRIYSVHLKASSGSGNEAQRALEVDSLRKVTNALPLNSNFVVCGDFNIYNSSESAYVKLKQVTANNDGRFIDPLTMTGTWNNISYAILHTQCTRDTALGTGGANGGMNDRFDMILYSNAISQAGGMTYVSGSMTAYGNDGNHYNRSIYLQPNTAVSPAVATALYNASDHLPVFAYFDFALNNCQSLDLATTALVSPTSPTCPSLSKNMQVRIKNTGLNAVDFSVNNTDVNFQITTPSSAVLNYVTTISSGVLSSGDSILVTMDSTLNMSATGNYIFNVSLTCLPDVNNSNNSLAPVTITASSVLTSTISPVGPVSICSGTSTTLTAAQGTGYQWSTGETTQSVSVSNSGNYSVSYSDLNGCLTNASPVNVSLINFQYTYTVVSENMGNVVSTISIATHETNNGFQNTSLTMSGTGDVRSTSISSGYPTASGGANIFLTSTAGKNFIIAGINTSTTNQATLSFGVFKSTTASNGSDLLVSFSTDGTNYFPLTFPALATGSGTAVWQYVTINEILPSVANLRIQFYQNGISTQYRIDDVLLTGKNTSEVIIPQGPTTFCPGGSVLLSASTASQYLWSSGQTTQNITANTTGNYSVTATGTNGCTIASAAVPVNASPCNSTITLTVYIDGLYNAAGTMKQVYGITQPGVCDTITLQLADANSPHSVIYQNIALLNTNGTVQFTFPSAITGNSFYFIIRYRNALEAWSSSAILISSSTFSYQFNDSPGKIYGSNQKNLNDGNFALFSGDINQDKIIDFSDLSAIIQQSQSFATGYLPFDLNGDGITETTDYSIVENNLFKSTARP